MVGLLSMLKAQAGPDRSDQGQEIDLGAWEVTGDLVQEYTQAVGDPLPLYFRCQLAPPLALAAWSLGRLLNHLKLPSGAIHSLQEMESLRAVRFGETVSASVQLSKPRRLGSLEFITAAYCVRSKFPDSDHGHPILTGKTTVLVPQSGVGERKEVPGPQQGGQESEHSGEPVGTGGLSPVERTINQARLDAYARASGDFNPLHLDPGFAATTQFGGIVAHGMLTLALISENMAEAFGRDWLDSGALKVRFKGAAYLGDHLSTRCRIIKEEPATQGTRAMCSVSVIHTPTRRELVSGTASAILKSETPFGAQESYSPPGLGR